MNKLPLELQEMFDSLVNFNQNELMRAHRMYSQQYWEDKKARIMCKMIELIWDINNHHFFIIREHIS